MRIIVFEQVPSKDPDEIFDENHIFDFEADIAPMIGMIIYSHGASYIESQFNIKSGKFEVIRVTYSVNNYTTKYELKTHLEVLVKQI